MRSIFGWSYPPGCSGPPEDRETFCPICGQEVCQHCNEEGYIKPEFEAEAAAILKATNEAEMAAAKAYAEELEEEDRFIIADIKEHPENAGMYNAHLVDKFRREGKLA